MTPERNSFQQWALFATDGALDKWGRANRRVENPTSAAREVDPAQGDKHEANAFLQAIDHRNLRFRSPTNTGQGRPVHKRKGFR
jgi:hypothetical protein